MARIYGALLDRKLHLSREQREQIERMVYEDHPAVAKQLQRIEPELAQLRHARHLRILAVLTPEQRTLAEQLDEKNERRHRDEIDLPPP